MLAKMELDPESVEVKDKTIADLLPAQLDTLDHWVNISIPYCTNVRHSLIMPSCHIYILLVV